MMKCRECGNMASYNPYIHAYYCSVCGKYFYPQYAGSTREAIDKLKECKAIKDGKMYAVPKDLLDSIINHLECTDEMYK